METTNDADRYGQENYYSFINDPGLTPEERYELALMAALDTAHLHDHQLDGFDAITKEYTTVKPDMDHLVAEAMRVGQVQWGVGIIAVGQPSFQHNGQRAARHPSVPPTHSLAA